MRKKVPARYNASMNFTFIGMTGAGKSYVGSRFAQKRGLRFVDIDHLMEERYEGKKLQAILDDIGDDQFLKEQQELVLEHEGEENLVLAPGGSVIYTREAMQFLKEHTTIVYLNVPYEIIRDRITAEHRGIVGWGDRPLELLYQERSHHYEEWADVSIEVGERPAEEIIWLIEQMLLLPEASAE